MARTNTISPAIQDARFKLLFPRFILLRLISVRTSMKKLSPAPINVISSKRTNVSKTVTPILDEASKEILTQKEEVSRLASVASKHPFYKYNSLWSRELQNLVR